MSILNSGRFNPRRRLSMVFLGEASVGKTSLISRFMFGSFNKAFRPTTLDSFPNAEALEGGLLQLWDSAGQERFRSLIPSNIRISTAAVVVYDVTDANSFRQATSKWMEDVRKELGTDPIVLLVGNKTDLSDERQVSTEEGREKAKELNVTFLETSTKVKLEEEGVFRRVAEAVLAGVESIYGQTDGGQEEEAAAADAATFLSSTLNEGVEVQPVFMESSFNEEEEEAEMEVVHGQMEEAAAAVTAPSLSTLASSCISISIASAAVCNPLRKVKLVFLGERSVGKTSLSTRLASSSSSSALPSKASPTLLPKTMHLEDRTVRPQQWDDAITSLLRSWTVAVAVVYDITNANSFHQATSKWIKDVRRKRGSDVAIVLVGNKADLSGDGGRREVSADEGRRKARELHVMFVETSAKTGHNVTLFFQKALDRDLRRRDAKKKKEERKRRRGALRKLESNWGEKMDGGRAPTYWERIRPPPTPPPRPQPSSD